MSANLSNQSLMTDLLHTFIQGATNGATNIMPDALALLGALGTIELAVSFIFHKDQDPLTILTEKFLKFGVFAWFTMNWATGMNISKQFFDTFQMFGIKMALGDGANGIIDPSGIIELGLIKTSALLASILQFSTAASVMGNIGLILLKMGLLFVLMGCYGWMALQLFVTYVEFYMTSTLTVVLLPLGVNRYTSFASEKAIGAVFSFCVKVLALQFILCIGIPLAEKWVIEISNTDLTPIFRATFGCLGLAFLTWKSPDYIQGLISGSPSFSAGSMVGGATTVAGGAMRVAGFTSVAMNAPGGRNNNGSVNWGGTVSNMGTILRQRMPDRQSAWHNQLMFSNAKAMIKQKQARNMAKQQTNLFD